MRLLRTVLLLAASVAALVTADPAAAQFTIGGDSRVNPNDFRITTFASGLNFPNGLARLSDGSILVATSNPNGKGTFWASSGELLRFTDTNGDGIADGPGQLMYSDPVGVWTGLAVAGNMVFIMSAKETFNRIIVLKMNNGPASPYTFVGTLNFSFPGIWEHKAYAMATRPAPGAPAGTWELYFNVGSSANADQNTLTVGLSGLLTGTMDGGTIYRVTVTEVGQGATVSNLVKIAAGLRNAAGMAFHPTTGDFYFEDNGIDGFQDPNEPLSADELNRIAAADLGRQPVPNFGFPNDYIDYHTRQRVGSGGVQPLVAFLPLPCASCPDPGDPNPDGAESEGPSGIVFAPPLFPPYVNNGVFVGFHGKFSAPPSENEENPLVFWDQGTGQYFHFIESFQLGHGDQLLSTQDSLFIADMTSGGSVDTNGGDGVIYQIKSRPTGPMSAAFTSPGEGSTVTGTVAVAMSETGGTGTITWTVQLDGTGSPIFNTSGAATTASFNWDTSTVAPGAHTLNLTAQDSAGHTAVATLHVTVTSLSASFTSPAEGATVSGTVPVGLSESGGTGTVTWTVRLDGGTTPIFTTSGTAATASFNWDTSGVPAGAHTLNLTVQDGAGRTATAVRHVTVGTGTLRVAITQPGADGATVSGTTWFVLWVEGAAAGTKTYTLSVNGTQVASTTDTSSGPISMAWDTTKVNNGSTTVIATARDSSGNTGSAPRVVNVSNSYTASFTSPAEGATVSGTVTVGMSESGANGTPIVFTLTVDGSQVFTTSGTATTASFNWNSNSVADGTHTLGLTVRDGAGRTATATRSVTVRTPTPIPVAFTSPPEGATVGGTITVSVSETGGTGTLNWTVTVDDPRRPPEGIIVICAQSGTASSISCSFDTTNVADGAHTLTATVQDGAGRSGTAVRHITVAQTLSASFTSPAEGATVTGTVPVGMSESNGTGTITWTLRLDGGSTPIFTTSGTPSTASFSWDTSSVAPGAHQLQLTVQDGGGRTATATRNVTVAGPLSASITSPAEGATVSGTVTVGMSETNGTGTITWTLRLDGGSTPIFTTSGTGSTASFNWDTSSVAPGAHTLQLTVQDGGGRTATATRNVTVSPPPLTASITTPTEGATVNGTVTVGMSESGGTGTITWTLRLDGGSTPIFTTSGTASTASFSWDTTSVSAGPHQLQLTVQDGGGRTATAVRNVTVQQGTIRVFITQPATDGTTVSGTVWFTIWLENAAAGTRNLTLSIDGAAVATTATASNGPISMPWNSTGASGGTHTATVSVRDSVNNTGSANRTVVTQGGPGQLQASFTSPAEGATVSGTVTVGMSATNASGTPISFTLSVDGGAPVFTTSGAATTASFGWNSNSVPSGPHTLNLTVQDGAGRTATATRNVTVAPPQPPGVQFDSPAEGATVGGTITVAASLTGGGTAPFTWTVKVDNSTQIFASTGSARSISFAWNTSTVPDGPHTLNVSVQDSSGATASAVRNVMVKQPPPPTIKVFITQPGADGATVSGTTWFTIWIENAAAGTKTFTMSVDGTAVGTTNTTSNGPVSMPWTTNGTPNGSHSVTISVRDSAGGTGSAVRVVNVAN
jgi:glucose/arabinose dehydrogenase